MKSRSGDFSLKYAERFSRIWWRICAFNNLVAGPKPTLNGIAEKTTFTIPITCMLWGSKIKLVSASQTNSPKNKSSFDDRQSIRASLLPRQGNEAFLKRNVINDEKWMLNTSKNLFIHGKYELLEFSQTIVYCDQFNGKFHWKSLNSLT